MLWPIDLIVLTFVIFCAVAAITVLRRSRGLYPGMVPAQGLTIVTHLAGGLLLCAGIVVGA